MSDKTKKIVQASWVGIAGNSILALLKIMAGLLAGSLAVLGDGIDSASDVVTYILTLLTARIMSRPPTVKFPYGFKRADTLAATALAFVIFFAGLQLAITSIEKLFSNETAAIPGKLAIIVTGISIIGKLALSLYQFKKGKAL